MSRHAPTPPGLCPRCAAHVAPVHTLIEYEGADGTPRAFAECPNCAAVIRPR